MIAKNRRILPYVGLAYFRNKTVLEVHLGVSDPPQRFPATDAGFKEAATCLARNGTESWLCSSSLDFPADYGLDEGLDLRQVLSEGVAKLRPPTPAGWWVLVATAGGELMNWGQDGDTKYPLGSEAEAVAQARHLGESKEGKDGRIYICKIFATGQLRFEEWEER